VRALITPATRSAVSPIEETLKAIATRDGQIGENNEPGFAGLAARHGLAGLVVKALNEDRLNIPEAAARGLRERWTRERRVSALLRLEAVRIVQATEKAGQVARPILLKGHAVASRYADPDVRTCVDVDLLVDEADALQCGQILRRLGYSPVQNAWRERISHLYTNDAEYHRRLDGGLRLGCEVHTRLFVDKRAFDFGYRELSCEIDSTPQPAIAILSTPALLVALSLHLAHHFKRDRKLIWYRDFIELGKPPQVKAARALSKKWGVDWALEWALGEVEETAGRKIWDARPVASRSGPIWKALEADKPEYDYQIAVVRELGLMRGCHYLALKLDPRRFLDDSGRFRPVHVGAWAMKLTRHVLDKFPRVGRGTRKQGPPPSKFS